MGFNLKKILRAFLFSTSEPLSIKDIQAVIQRYHAEQEAARAAQQRNAAKSDSGEEPSESAPDAPAQSAPNSAIQSADNAESPAPQDSEQGLIEDIIAQVPTLLTATQIREAMEEIAAELEESGSVYRLLQSSSGFKFAISDEYAEWVRLLRNDPRPQKLSRAAMETLAIVAYRQPVTRAEIEAIRGVNSDGALARLTDKDLIFASGRADLPGRPVQYSTTQNFLDFIGANSLDELPASDVLSPGQISEWIRRASNPASVGDSDVGLSNEEDSQQADSGGEELSGNAQPSDGGDAEPSADNGAQEEMEPAMLGDASFPADSAESAGSQEEFERPFGGGASESENPENLQ